MSTLQQFLLDNGFNPGAIDGLWGPRTKAAWTKFATDNGLPTDSLEPAIWGMISTGDFEGIVAGPGGDPTFDQGQGGTGIPGTDGTIDAEELEKIKERFPNLVYLLDNPELAELFERAIADDGMSATEFTLALEATEWFKSMTASQRLFDASVARDPASANQRVADQRLALQVQMNLYGLRVSSSVLDTMAMNAVRNGTTEQQMLMQVGDLARAQLRSSDTGLQGGSAEGQLKAIVQRLQGDARSYHLGFSESQMEEWAIRIVEGRWSYDAAQATMRQQASKAFPQLADQIMQGTTVEDYFAPTKNRLAQMLEVNPNSIDLTSDKYSSITQMVSDDGNVRPMTFAEIGKFARQQDAYWATEQGTEESYGLANGLLSTFGLI